MKYSILFQKILWKLRHVKFFDWIFKNYRLSETDDRILMKLGSIRDLQNLTFLIFLLVRFSICCLKLVKKNVKYLGL